MSQLTPGNEGEGDRVLSRSYGVFVLRIWLEPSAEGAAVWRASLTDTLTKERRYFAEPAALSHFLLASNLPGGARPGLEPDL